MIHSCWQNPYCGGLVYCLDCYKWMWIEEVYEPTCIESGESPIALLGI